MRGLKRRLDVLTQPAYDLGTLEEHRRIAGVGANQVEPLHGRPVNVTKQSKDALLNGFNEKGANLQRPQCQPQYAG